MLRFPAATCLSGAIALCGEIGRTELLMNRSIWRPQQRLSFSRGGVAVERDGLGSNNQPSPFPRYLDLPESFFVRSTIL